MCLHDTMEHGLSMATMLRNFIGGLLQGIAFLIPTLYLASIVTYLFRLWLSHCVEIMFPWLSAKIHMPEKMSADHVTLMVLMTKCSTIIKGLKHQDTEAAEAVKELQVGHSTA